MSEKRFTLEISSFSSDCLKFARVYDNGKLIGTSEMVDLLNEQHSVIDEQDRRIRKLEDILKKFQFPVERV